MGFAWMVITAGLLVATVNLHIAGRHVPCGVTPLALSLVAFLWGMRKGGHRRPQSKIDIGSTSSLRLYDNVNH
jgi:hypothetical protein